MSCPSRLLIVDDEPVHRRFASVVLGGAGWTVDEAADGAAALRAIAATRYAVVLLDIGLPDLDGFAVARRIRGDRGIDPAVPILAFTSFSAEDVADRAAAAGIDGHIAKPVAADALVERLARWWPEEISPARARLADVFGAREIAALNENFRAQLSEALEAIDQPQIADVAHRIAGVAGTLGFPEIHETWLALSETRPGARDAAASAARRTLRTLILS